MDLENGHDLYLNRYKNAVFFVDNEINKVLDALKSRHLLENTVIIITGDHGEEFNDSHDGYWGHASNYTVYQIRTPLIVRIPNERHGVFSHVTSHFDILPTLLQKMFLSKTATKSYSVGTNLLDKNSRPYFIIGSYVDYAVVDKDQITTISPFGYFQIYTLDGKFDANPKLNSVNIAKALQDTRVFYQK